MRLYDSNHWQHFGNNESVRKSNPDIRNNIANEMCLYEARAARHIGEPIELE